MCLVSSPRGDLQQRGPGAATGCALRGGRPFSPRPGTVRLAGMHVHPCCRLAPASDKRNDFLQDLRHWHIHDLLPTCERLLDNKNATPEQERVSCEIYKGSRPQRDGQVHQTHLQRSPVSKEVQKNPHIKQNQCDCLPRFTRRAFSNPPLLALLPLDDDVLRERPQAACLVIGG